MRCDLYSSSAFDLWKEEEDNGLISRVHMMMMTDRLTDWIYIFIL